MIQKELKEILKLLSPTGSVVALDVETTGLNSEDDMIIEIGATKLNIDDESYEPYSELINPGVSISEFITELTGISDKDVEDSPVIDEIKDNFTDFYCNEKGEQHLIIAHNANFDIGFLRKNGFKFTGTIIDTYDLAFVLLDKGEYNLQALASLFDIKVEKFHRAKNDSGATLDLFIELLKVQLNLGSVNIKFSDINLTENSGIKFAPKFISNYISGSNLLETEKRSDNKKDTVNKKTKFADNCSEFFSNNGIGRYIENYEKRLNQIEMSEFIEKKLPNSGINLIEASPGTGKTLGYLAPIVLDILENNSKAVIATNTIALQDQIINKDWNLIKTYLKDSGKSDDISVSILKGRKNYLCKEIIKYYEPNDFREARVLFKLIKWNEYTVSGDISEVDLKNDHYVFSKFSSANESCIKKCNKCYIDIARKKAEESEILLINHSLAMSTSISDRSLLKDISYLVIDEAHEIQNVATDAFTKRVNINTLLNLNKSISNYLDSLNNNSSYDATYLISFIDKSEKFIEKVLILNNFLKENIENSKNYGKYLFDDNSLSSTMEIIDVFEFAKEMRSGNLFENVYEAYEGNEENLFRNIINSISLFEEEIHKLISIFSLEDTNMVSWFEMFNRENFELISSPISVKDELRETIFKDQENVILTGATLTSFDSPDEFSNQIGLDYLDEYRIFDSEFDYEKNVFFYVPKDMPEPNNELYAQNLSDLIVNISEKNLGKILVLFTSYSSLNSVRKKLKESFLNKKIISQGVDGGAARVISKFRKEGSILLATGPIWQGVDFGFDVDIKVLIISKLPFAVPNDPLINARSQKYMDPFNEYLVPDAVRRFKQGIGRLIRSNEDYGAIVCGDIRIITKNYGENFLNCLPGYSFNENLIIDSGEYIKNWIDNHG